MFDLETAIAEWRTLMLATGIKSPVPLEELEAHLREETTRQIKSGVIESEAFNSAAEKIGPASLLNTEFGKTRGPYGFLSKPRTLRLTLSMNGILGLVWLFALSSIFLRSYAHIPEAFFDAKALLYFLFLFGAIVGSVLLVFDSKWGRCITRTNALLWLAVWSIQDGVVAYYLNNQGIRSMSPRVSIRNDLAEQSLLFAFLLVSILILHLPAKANLKATVKL
jgi:hypothetical protein